MGPLFGYVCFIFIFNLGPFLLCFYSCIRSTFSLQTSVKTSSINLRSTSITHSTIKSLPLTLNSFIKSPQSVIITINFKHMVHSTHNIIGGRVNIILSKCERVVGWGARLQHHGLAVTPTHTHTHKVYSF